MSFGGPYFSRGINSACDFAFSNGSVLVSATGNDGKDEIMYPAGYNTVIAVGAVNEYKERANFSNYGENLTL